MALDDAALRGRARALRGKIGQALNVSVSREDAYDLIAKVIEAELRSLRDAVEATRAESQEDAAIRARDELMEVVADSPCLHGRRRNPHASSAELLACVIHALRDAARAEQRETIKMLMNALTELASKRRAANWQVINDAMVAGAAAIRAQEEKT